MLAPVYINDFTDGGRVKRVTMQADSEFRTGPESLSRFYTPAPNQSASAEGASGEGTAMIPISNRSEEHTSELQSLMRISYAVFCLKKKNRQAAIYRNNNCERKQYSN